MVIFTIAWKEFKSLMTSPVAYIFLAIFVFYPAFRYFALGVDVGQSTFSFFDLKRTDLALYFSNFPVAFMLLIPALSMRLWPDEIKRGTVELLFTYPIKIWHVVVGKFLAGMLLLIIALALTAMVPYVVGAYGDIDMGPVYGSYAGALALGAAFLSVGLFMGALCKEQVSAFILAFLVCLAFVTLGSTMVNQFIPQALHGLSDALSFTKRFHDLGRGVVPLKDVVYFLTFSVVFLVLNVAVLQCRKGR